MSEYDTAPSAPDFERRDPSTEQWREAMGRSTSAKLRAAEAELGAALSALGRASAEVERLRTLLKDAYDANLRLINERATEPTQEQP